MVLLISCWARTLKHFVNSFLNFSVTHSTASQTSASCLFLFFFQAEDGIRDTSVTGVQTCALPISLVEGRRLERFVAGVLEREEALKASAFDKSGLTRSKRRLQDALVDRLDMNPMRSEERRVGKECRARWWREQ